MSTFPPINLELDNENIHKINSKHHNTNTQSDSPDNQANPASIHYRCLEYKNTGIFMMIKRYDS